MVVVLYVCLYKCTCVCVAYVWMHAHLVQILLLESLVHACVEEGLEGHLVRVYVCDIWREKKVIYVKKDLDVVIAMEVSQGEAEEAPACCRSSPCR